MKNRTLMFLALVFSIVVSFAQEDNGSSKSVSVKALGKMLKQKNDAKSLKQQTSLDYNVDVSSDTLENTSFAHETDSYLRPMPRKNFFNAGFSYIDMELPGLESLNPYYGVNFSIGRTFFFNNNQDDYILYWGLDVVWLDVNYNNYRLKFVSKTITDEFEYHQVEVGVQVGPSLSVNFSDDVKLSVYVRYAPSISMLYADDVDCYGFGSFYVAGASIFYKRVGLSIDYRYGDSKYKDWTSRSGLQTEEKEKCLFEGFRGCLTFRF